MHLERMISKSHILLLIAINMNSKAPARPERYSEVALTIHSYP